MLGTEFIYVHIAHLRCHETENAPAVARMAICSADLGFELFVRVEFDN